MPLRFLKPAVLVSLSSVLIGCVSLPSYRPELPEDIGDKGLVVGQVVGIGRLSGWSHRADVLINDRKRGHVVNGFIATPLSAGEYSLDGLYTEYFGGTNTYGSVTVTTKNTTTLPLKRKFKVQPGAVTNLGLIVLYPDPGDKEHKKFMRLFVDNTADMKRFVNDAYPLLARRLKVDAMALSPGELMPDNLLELLRKEIATKEARAARGYARYVAGDVGTLAQVKTDGADNVSGVQLIPVPTVSNIQSETPNYVKDRFAFLTKNNRLFFVQDGKATEKRPPDGLRAAKIYALGTSDLVIVDDKLEIYMSTNNGDRWQPHLGAVQKDKVNAKLAAGANGYYVYTVQSPSVLYNAYGRAEFRPVALPADAKSLGLLREKPVGLFAEREISFYKETEKRPFYVRPAGKAAWDTLSMPAANCEYIRFQDTDGVNLSTACGDRAVGFPGPKDQYTSRDSGRSWQKK